MEERVPHTRLELQAALAWRTATDPAALRYDRNGDKIPKRSRPAYGRLQLGEHALYLLRMGETKQGINELTTAARGFDGSMRLAMALKALGVLSRRALGKDAEANAHTRIRQQLDRYELD